jgi:hypothetical protein
VLKLLAPTDVLAARRALLPPLTPATTAATTHMRANVENTLLRAMCRR